MIGKVNSYYKNYSGIHLMNKYKLSRYEVKKKIVIEPSGFF